MESIRQTHIRLVVRWWLCIAGGLSLTSSPAD
jgi:hypothetical protein